MGRRFTAFVLALAIALVTGMFQGRGNAAPDDLPTPAAPLLMPSGESVQIAWTLPLGPKPEFIRIFRTTQSATRFEQVAEVRATDLRYEDSGLQLGETYQYRLQATRGAKTSDYSKLVSVKLGGSAKITFLGGSTSRALFEIELFRKGLRVTSSFVQQTGDEIGDLAYVRDLEEVVDFRLGPKLMKLELGVSESRETHREKLRGVEGEPLTTPGGAEINLDFNVPGRTHEVLKATLRLENGQTTTLTEGQSRRFD